jgi:ACS family tartrate transporter-like MFS transporter
MPNPPRDLLRTALRKASIRLLPLLAVGYFLAILDRANVGYAALQMNRDLHFSATVYGVGAGLFFLPYAACALPSSLLLARIGGSRWLGSLAIAWGIASAAMLLVRTPGQFYTARLLVGAAEAGFLPGVVFYLSQWFPPSFRARAIAGFYVGLPISAILMPGLANSILKLSAGQPLRSWQWLFLLEGLPAILGGIVLLALLPDGPADATWLTPPERAALSSAAEQRSDNQTRQPSAMGRAIANPRVWLLGLVQFCVFASAYILLSSAAAILQQASHLSTREAASTLVAFHILGAFALWLGAILSDRTGRPYALLLYASLTMTGGFLLVGAFSNPTSILLGLALLFLAYYALLAPLWTVTTTCMPGLANPAAMAIIATIGITGGFFGPYAIGLARVYSGTYQRGLLLIAPIMAAAVVLIAWVARMAKADRPNVPAFVSLRSDL